MWKSVKTLLTLLAGAGLFLHNTPAKADTLFSLGVEGYTDQYKEPIADVDTTAGYGGITASYQVSQPNWFLGIDGRADFGLAKYSSVDGTAQHEPQYETEFRLYGGPTYTLNGGSEIAPYIGIGTRLYFDQSAHTFTDLGFGGYNRYIQQVYAPVGASWTFRSGDWTITPNAEYDQLLYGHVWSGLKEFTGYDVTNTQSSGYGVRGALMFGTRSGKYLWEAGPYFRYWDIKNSDVFVGPDGDGWIEPHNTRLQVGAQARLLFW
jgi:hypothetical protein